MSTTECLFCKLKDNNENIVYENENLYVLSDRFPFSNRHLLIIPKIHRHTLIELEDELIIEAFLLAKTIAKKLKLEKYNLLQNNINGQIIPHFHVHLIGCNETGGLKTGAEKIHLSLSDEEYSKLSKEIKKLLSDA